MYGAAISFVFAKVLMVSIVVALSKNYGDSGYRVIRMLKIIIPSILFMSVGLFFSYTNSIYSLSWSNVIYKLFIVTLYIGFVFVTSRKHLVTAYTIILSYFKDKNKVDLTTNMIE